MAAAVNSNPTQPSQFIQFGCWNNLNQKKSGQTKGCLKSVSDKLNKYVTENKNKIHSIVVSGDNYYPDKKEQSDGTKLKTINATKLADGFRLLPQDIPITMILGNHDLETNEQGETTPYIFKTGTTEQAENGTCQILDEQFKSLSQNIDYVFCKSVPLSTHTILIMIDTSLYDVNSRNDYLKCYQIFFQKKGMSPLGTIEEIKAYQQNEINRIMASAGENIKNIVLVGHHPIMLNKYKEKEKTEKNGTKTIKKSAEQKTDISDIKPLLLSMHNTKPLINYFYLCSDLHLYQKGIITIDDGKGGKMEINQYISGIGGTELDPPMPRDFTPTIVDTNSGIKYQMVDEQPKCGFLVCDYSNGDKLKFNTNFIEEQSLPNNPSGAAAATEIASSQPSLSTQPILTPPLPPQPVPPPTGGGKRYKRKTKKRIKKTKKNNKKINRRHKKSRKQNYL